MASVQNPAQNFFQRVSETCLANSRRMTWLLTLAKSTQRHYTPSSAEFVALGDISDFLRQQEELLSNCAAQSAMLVQNVGHAPELNWPPLSSPYTSFWRESILPQLIPSEVDEGPDDLPF